MKKKPPEFPDPAYSFHREAVCEGAKSKRWFVHFLGQSIGKAYTGKVAIGIAKRHRSLATAKSRK